MSEEQIRPCPMCGKEFKLVLPGGVFNIIACVKLEEEIKEHFDKEHPLGDLLQKIVGLQKKIDQLEKYINEIEDRGT
jgi:hypothetical protein